MKHIYLLLAISALCCTYSNAQNCCQKKDGMQALALNTDFRQAHEPPLPFVYNTPKGTMIQFETLDAKKGSAYYIPSDEPTTKVLIIFHEWWGLNDYIKKEADKWQKLLGNIDVYAVDLYDGKVATDVDMASQYASGLDDKRCENIVKGMLSKIGGNKQIATLGWCMGGGWSFTAARLAGQETVACVMYYGYPEKDDKKVATIKSDVLYIYALQDKFIQKPFVDEFGRKVVAAGHQFELHTYDAVHAFANPSNPNFNALAAAQAQNVTEAFLKKRLGID